MSEPRMTPADHVFAHALSCVAVPVFRDPEMEAAMIDIALGLLPRVSTGIGMMRTLSLALADYRSRGPDDEWRGMIVLREAVGAFHKWRVGAGMDAVAARAA